MTWELVPLTRVEAHRFVVEHHRHSRPPVGDVCRVGLSLDGELVGVAIAGRPLARRLDDGRSLEVLRVCTLGHQNASSRLYGAIARAAKALGYRTLWTYTLASEPGTSVRAAGFRPAPQREPDARDWATRSRSRPRYESNLFGETLVPQEAKQRWRRDLCRSQLRERP
jgi:hypothetical protein